MPWDVQHLHSHATLLDKVAKHDLANKNMILLTFQYFSKKSQKQRDGEKHLTQYNMKSEDNQADLYIHMVGRRLRSGSAGIA